MMIGHIHEEASNDNYSIIEINFNPAIHIHCYPYQGMNRRADDKILDLLFGPVQM
ncbi:Glutathione biosynthesis bifunctional protein GshAB [compost metagenome]